ncbi:hypothetical protein [Actinotalea solisilvae]|uniref:hypothetical protein n=1 Tax=Actinotalea solisilvae TaxID=2072922 RepID=UPI0018F1C868|nr:hypothetical protein [Actinotalea solisilvae]
MRTVWALAHGPLRGAPGRARGRAGARLTPGVLAVVGFAVTTAFALSVVGGLLGFTGRAEDPTSALMADLAPTYVTLAWIAVVLLVVPLVTLGAGAARLGVARRDARLATLRLLGATGGEVVALTVLETARQGLVGAAVGVVGYGLLLPVFSSIPFMGQAFSAGELWVGLPAIGIALAAVPLVAALSAAVSLRRVVVTPLGVARRTTPPGLRWVRGIAVVLAVVAFAAVAKLNLGMEGAVVTVVLLGLLGLVLGAINLAGPWLIGLMARLMVRRASTPARLLAGRRLLDDPRAAWRVVAGLGLGGFVAGIVSVLPAVAQSDGDPASDLLAQDMLTGGILTLSIAFVVAAASAGIAQAASVLDRRQEYALQHLAGVPAELFDAVRRRVVIAPLVLVAGTSAAVGLGVLLPLFGPALVTAPQGLVVLVLCLLLGGLLVVGAAETSRPLLRAVLRETDVRPG